MTSTSTRNTWQRAAVWALLANTEEFCTAAQIHSDLRQAGDKVGLATVHRALRAMSESGDLDILRTPDGETAYRTCSSTHHHHLVCRFCGIAVEISAEAVESWVNQVTQEHGFTGTGCNLEISGLCRSYPSWSRPALARGRLITTPAGVPEHAPTPVCQLVLREDRDLGERSRCQVA